MTKIGGIYMKYCYACGKLLEDIASFCPHCGKEQSVGTNDKSLDAKVSTATPSIIPIIVMSVIAVALSILGLVLHSVTDVAEIGESVYGASIGLGVTPLILAALCVKKSLKLYTNDKSKSMQVIYAISIIVLILSAIAAIVGVGVVLAANNIQMFFPLIAICGVGAFMLFRKNKKKD